MKLHSDASAARDAGVNRETFDLDSLFHPARAFAHPLDVVRDPDMTRAEKRAVLASWASDACAVEAAPDLRVSPGGKPVAWDDIMDALRMLDDDAPAFNARGGGGLRRRLRRWRRPGGSHGAAGHGPLLV